ncbi:hypothetical protein [Bifidobacterium colobi]|nr:hypothetical protein [Bifidobacterium colobi]
MTGPYGNPMPPYRPQPQYGRPGANPYQAPYGMRPQYVGSPMPPYRPPKRSHAGIIIAVVLTILLVVGLVFGATAVNGIRQNLRNSVNPDTAWYADIIPCTDSAQYVAYSKLVEDKYTEYQRMIDQGTIFTSLDLPADEDSGNYVKDFMLILTDRRAAVRMGCEMTTSKAELDDIYRTRINEVNTLESKFRNHEDLEVNVKITRSDGSVYESDGKAPKSVDVDTLEEQVRNADVQAGADGTWLEAGERLAQAAGLTLNYDYQQIYNYCRDSDGDDSTTVASYCAAVPDLIFMNRNRSDWQRTITRSDYPDVIRHELGHAFVYKRCRTTNPPLGVSSDALANSYALKYLGGDRTNLQKNIGDFPEYTITDASDQAAEQVHAGQCGR